MVTIPPEIAAFTPAGKPVVVLIVVAPVTAYVIGVIGADGVFLHTFCKVVAAADVSVIVALEFTVVVFLAALLPVQPAALE